MHWGYLKLKGAAATIRTAVWSEVGVVQNLADETVEIPSRDGKRTITVDIYRPPGQRQGQPTSSAPLSASGSASSSRSSSFSFLRRPAPPSPPALTSRTSPSPPRSPGSPVSPGSPTAITAPGAPLSPVTSGSPVPGEPSSNAYLVNFHASYSVLDALRRTDVHFLQQMANETGHVVYDVHYRLAPEHPFPAAFEDGEDVIKSLPPDAQVSLSGFASGGNLALSLSSTSDLSSRVSSVFTCYPLVDFTLKEKGLQAPDPSSPGKMSAEAAGVLNDCYLYGGVDPTDPRVSPALAPASKFPKDVFFYTAAQDPHCLSGEDMVQKIKEAGKDVRWKRYDGCGSLFDKKPEPGSGKEKATMEMYRMYADYLRGQVKPNP